MAGLFDFGDNTGGGDIGSLLQKILGVGSAEAAGGQLTPEALRASQAAQNPLPPSTGVVPPTTLPFGEPGGVGTPNLPPEVNPSPVAPGQVPLPRPVPPELGAPPAAVAGANRGLGAVPLNAAPQEPTLGAALTGDTGLPSGAQGPTRSGAPLATGGTSSSTDIGGRAKTPEDKAREGLADALKGVTGPKPPELQRISSPNPPRPTGTIKAGDLQALLLALNAGAPAMERKLPMTLGQGLGRG